MPRKDAHLRRKGRPRSPHFGRAEAQSTHAACVTPVRASYHTPRSSAPAARRRHSAQVRMPAPSSTRSAARTGSHQRAGWRAPSLPCNTMILVLQPAARRAAVAFCSQASEKRSPYTALMRHSCPAANRWSRTACRPGVRHWRCAARRGRTRLAILHRVRLEHQPGRLRSRVRHPARQVHRRQLVSLHSGDAIRRGRSRGRVDTHRVALLAIRSLQRLQPALVHRAGLEAIRAHALARGCVCAKHVAEDALRRVAGIEVRLVQHADLMPQICASIYKDGGAGGLRDGHDGRCCGGDGGDWCRRLSQHCLLRGLNQADPDDERLASCADGEVRVLASSLGSRE